MLTAAAEEDSSVLLSGSISEFDELSSSSTANEFLKERDEGQTRVEIRSPSDNENTTGGNVEEAKETFLSSIFLSPEATLEALRQYATLVGFVPISNGVRLLADGAIVARLKCKVKGCPFSVQFKRERRVWEWRHYRSQWDHSGHTLTPARDGCIPEELKRRATKIPQGIREEILYYLEEEIPTANIIVAIKERHQLTLAPYQLRDIKSKARRKRLTT